MGYRSSVRIVMSKNGYNEFQKNVEDHNKEYVDKNISKDSIIYSLGHDFNLLHRLNINKESNNNIKKIMDSGRGGKRRPVIIILEDGRCFLGSSFMVGHAGVDSEPYLKILTKRSNGYGKGENYDSVKGNGMDGHICLFVEGCRNHFDGKENKEHNKNLEFLKDMNKNRRI